MQVLNVGLMGCGRIALLVHLALLLRLPGIRVVAIAEPDPARRAEAARRAPAAAVVADGRELLGMPEVEAVFICTPNDQHARDAEAAFAAGKHVYLEKPLAIGPGEGGAVLEAWRRSGRVGMIGFNYRFHPLYLEAKRQIESGRLGAPVAIRSVFATPARELPPWKQRRQTGGGVLLDLASHHVDLARFLLGREVRDVSAHVRSLRSEDDTATLELRLEGGLTVQSFFSMSAVDEDRFEVFGEAGKLTIDRHHSSGLEILGPGRDGVRLRRVGQALRSLGDSPLIRQRLMRRDFEPSYRAAFAHFADASRGRIPARPDLRDGYRSLAVIAAAEESARVGRPIRPGEVPAESPAGQR